jgi:hypothetical protein
MLNKPKSILTATLFAVLGLGVALVPSRGEAADRSADLSVAEFRELKPILDVKNQPWTTIPWQYSITEARKLAAATKKPIFMVINTGNCLGCV